MASTLPTRARVVVIGDARVFDQGCRDAGIRLACRVYDDVDAVEWNGDAVPLIDLGNIDPAQKAGDHLPQFGEHQLCVFARLR